MIKAIDREGHTYIKPYATTVESKLMSEGLIRSQWAVDYIRVYSDSCCTELNNINHEDHYNDKPLDPNVYKHPSYNQGVWSYNYLRNILDNKNTKQNGNLISDESSLIYGKYFVVRFVFEQGRKFKLENVIFNV